MADTVESPPRAPAPVLELVDRIVAGFSATPDLKVLDRKDRAVMIEDAEGHKLMVGVQLCQ